MSSRIREDLLARAGEFHIKLEDVSITHLTFGKVLFRHDSALDSESLTPSRVRNLHKQLRRSKSPNKVRLLDAHD